MQFYKYDINDMTDAEADERFSIMSNERKSVVMKLISTEKRKAKIAADYLCRKAISEFCGINPEEIEFFKNEYGKPFARNLPVNFSISHSGNIVVCAISGNEVGTDIEKIRSASLRTAKKFASDEEFKYISSCENGFFEIWTLKEAYFKCIGTGLGADIKNVSFNITPSGIICSEKGFELSFVDAENGYICAVCKKTTFNNQ